MNWVKRAVAGAFGCLAAVNASACSICNANLSYSFFPFAAVWFYLYLAALTVVGGLYLIERRRGTEAAAVALVFKRGVKFLAVLLVLYVLGLHLVAILVLPLVVILAVRPLKQRYERVGLVVSLFVAALVIVVPLSYAVLPKVASEPQTRTVANRLRKDLQSSLIKGDKNGIRIQSADPFAYVLFDVPLLNTAAQAVGTFYQPLPEPANAIRLVEAHGVQVAWSRGPDGKFQIGEQKLRGALEGTTSTTSIASMQYDPTNGIISGGDILVLRSDNSGHRLAQ